VLSVCRKLLHAVELDLARERGQNFFLGLEPVVYFRTGLIASPEIEFVSSASDSFFAWKHFDWGFLCAGGRRHGITSGGRAVYVMNQVTNLALSRKSKTGC
jgi:hypothetical protein